MKQAARRSLADTAAEAIEQELAAGRWAVGDKLPNEATLATMLAVSRGTIREAVRALVSRDLLEVRQGSGTYVLAQTCPPDSLRHLRRARLRDLVEVRRALEVEAVRLTAARLSGDTVARLEDLLTVRGPYSASDHDSYIARDLAFHRAITLAAGNPALLEVYDIFTASIRSIIDATVSGELPEPDYAAHAAIIQAIATGDPDQAEASVRTFWEPVFHDLERRDGA